MEAQAAPKETSKKVFIKSKNKSETDNTKTVYFDEPFTNVKEVKLKSIQVHNSFANINKGTKTTITIVDNLSKRYDRDLNYTLDAFYTIDDFINTINLFLEQNIWPENIRGKVKLKYQYDNSINEIVITKEESDGLELNTFRITSKFLQRLGFINTDLLEIPAKSNYGVKLQPYTNLYVHCNLFNGSLYNGKRSNILCSLPIDQSKRWWDTVTYNDLKCNFVPYKKDFNCIELCITDRKGNHIDFNDYPIIYELEIVTEVPKPPTYEKQLDEIISCLKAIKDKELDTY